VVGGVIVVVDGAVVVKLARRLRVRPFLDDFFVLTTGVAVGGVNVSATVVAGVSSANSLFVTG
jgi:hypothetical protein